jgi:hypothetical protein
MKIETHRPVALLPSRRMPAARLTTLALGALVTSLTMSPLPAADSFLTGGDPAAGEYITPGPVRTNAMEGSPGSPDIGLVWQEPVIPGFTGEWLIANGALGEVAPFGMGVSGLASAGGMGSTDVNNHGTRFGRQLASPFTNSTTGTYYMSIVLMGNQDFWSHGYRAMEFHDGGFDDGSHRRFQLGIHKVGEASAPDPGDFGANHYWGFRVNNSGSLIRQFPYQGVDSTEANLFVIKFVMSTAAGGDSVTVWHNPDPASFGGTEPAGGITVSGIDLAFDRVSFASWENPFWFNPYDGTLFFDEIRLGTTWAAVTPQWEPQPQDGDFLMYEFNGWLEGWEELTVPNANWGPQRWMGATGGDARSIPASPAAAKQYLHLDARWPGGADLAHPTLWMRSPQFRLNGAGDLTFWIMGGGANTNPNAFVPTNDSEVPANSVDTLDGGWHGVVLRNADTGAFELIGNRNYDDFDWVQVTFTAAQLAALDQNANYTLDAIDARNNAWAWFNLDSVSIPGTLGVSGNQAPTISPIPNQVIERDTSTGPLAFTIADDTTGPDDIVLTKSSSNQTLVPDANIVLGGTGANRTVTVTPVAGLTGQATITLTASDGEASRNRTFSVIVHGDRLVFDFDDATLQGWATVSGSASQQVFAAKTHGPLFNSSPGPQAGSHMVGVNFGYNPPIDSPWDGAHQTMWIRSPEFTLDGSGDLTAWLTGGSQTWNSGVHPMANSSDVPANSLNGNGFMGIALRQIESGNFVALRGLPENNAFGWTQVTISATELAPYANDGKSYALDLIDARHGGFGLIALDSVTIPGEIAGNQAPTISVIPNQSIPRNANTGAIAFTIGDDTTAPQDLILTKASSNPTLVPEANIVFGGSGANRTVTVTPASGLVGEATITITVSDGAASTPRSFLLSVFGERIVFDFDDGTLQGWEVVSTDALGRQLFAIVPPASPSPNITPHSGGHFLGLQIPAFTMDPPAYTQDSGHDTLWMRSPEFKLNGSGENLSAWLCGGHGYGADATGKLVANVPAQAFDDPGNAIFPSFLGIALRNVDTGVFVLAGTKASPGSDWQQVTFTAAQLAALDQDATYTLDLLDVRQGGWGWVNLDTVAIPGTLVGGADPYRLGRHQGPRRSGRRLRRRPRRRRHRQRP